MLPTQKTPPRNGLSDLTVLVYGLPKAGKSTFCSHSDGALFLATEAGLNSLEVFQTPISSWEQFLAACREVSEGKHKFKTIIVDTIDNAYKFCSEYICAKHKIEHESDFGYGKGWALVNNEFYRVLNKLSMLPYGLFMVSHAQDKEMETRTGKYVKTVPTLPDKARKLVLGMSDMILFCDLDSSTDKDGNMTHRRVIRSKPSRYYEAGDRTGYLPEVIDLDFHKFIVAFESGRRPKAANKSQKKEE